MGTRVLLRTALAVAVAAMVASSSIASLGVGAQPASAMTAPTVQDTARLLGYMWGDGEQLDNGVWDVNGPSGTSSLIEELVERHGGTWVDRGRLQFRLPAPYNWSEWKTGLPDDSDVVRTAVQSPHFLAALLETEASVGGQIYDQSACCVNGYRVGRLTALRDLMRSQGYSTTSVEVFTDPNSGRVMLAASEWLELRNNVDFVCPESNSVIRIPGGTALGQYGNLDWLGADSAWGTVIRTDCRDGQAVPDATAPAGTCVASVQGDQLRVDWTYTLGEVVIRINGTYVDSESGRDGSWVGSAIGGNNVELRVYAFGDRHTTTCSPGQGDGARTCTVTANGNQVNLSWEDVGAGTYHIRQNGSWATSTGSTSATVSGSTQDSWVIRYRQNGVTGDLTCGDGGETAGPCSITSRTSGVRVDWDGVGGVDDYQVRRNGSWVGAVSGASRYDDTSGSLNASYEIRYWISGERFSINCN